MIVGFCGETEAEFQNTVKAVREIGFDQAYMFAYSPRHTTEAWDWEDNVPAEVKQRRLSELLLTVNEVARDKNRAAIGEIGEVMVEGLSDKDKSRVAGRTRTNKLVYFPGDLEVYPPGSLVDVQLNEAYLWGFVGEALRTVNIAPRSRTIMELTVV